MDEEKFSELINQNKGNLEFMKKLRNIKNADDLIAFSKEYNLSVEDYELAKVLSTLRYFVLGTNDKTKILDDDLDISGGVYNVDQRLLKMFESLI